MDNSDQVLLSDNSSMDNIQKKIVENPKMDFKFFSNKDEPQIVHPPPENERKLKLVTTDIHKNFPMDNFTPNFDAKSPPALLNKRYQSKNNILHIDLTSGSQAFENELKKKTIFHHYKRTSANNLVAKKEERELHGKKDSKASSSRTVDFENFKNINNEE
jgi:hypothetical protein